MVEGRVVHNKDRLGGTRCGTPVKAEQPLPSEEEKALREDRRWADGVPHLSLDSLPPGYRGGIFEVNPDTPAADEERIRQILVQFWEEGRRCMSRLAHRAVFWRLQGGMSEEEYIEKRLDEIFAEQGLARPSKPSCPLRSAPAERQLHKVSSFGSKLDSVRRNSLC
jgi:hypothetical protein